MIAFQLSGHASDLAFALLLAITYLVVLRFVDPNEKEPFWAVGLLFVFGAAASVVLSLLVSSPTLRLNIWSPAVAEETARLTAIVAGAVALWAIGEIRGWREISGPMDGIVYGAAAGLGFATARVLIDRMVLADTLGPAFLSGPETIGATALAQLADGLFGGLIGAGVGAAVGSARLSKRIGLPLLGWIAAIAAHAGFIGLVSGHAFGGAPQARAWLALLVPLLGLVAVGAAALMQERRAIREQLPGEESVTPDEFEALRSLRSRASRSWRALASGDFERWAGRRALQNRLVQLAMVKQRWTSEGDPNRRRSLEAEAARLRASAAAIKRALDMHSSSGAAEMER